MPSESAKVVKAENKDEDEEWNHKTFGSKKVNKATSTNSKPQLKAAKVKKEDGSPAPVKAPTSASRSREAKVKKEESDVGDDDDDDDDDEPLSKRTSNLKLDKEAKKKNTIKKQENKKGNSAAELKKREKKVYGFPGQKRDPPEEKDPLRIFYGTLYKQVPNSEMAQVWMMESGLLPEAVAMKVYEKKQKKGLQQKVTSPVTAVTAVKSSTRNTPSSPMSSVKRKTTDSTLKQSKKRKVEDDSDDDNVVIARVKRRKAA